MIEETSVLFVYLFLLLIFWKVFRKSLRKNVFVGTFSCNGIEGKPNGVYFLSFSDRFRLLSKRVVIELENPAFLVLKNKDNLLIVERKEKDSFLHSFDVKNINEIRRINSVSTGYRSLCHISIGRKGRFVFTTNYIGGCISMVESNEKGEISLTDQFVVEEENSHVHSSVVSIDNQNLYVADLGRDKIWIFRINHQNKSLEANNDYPFYKCRLNSGPRMLKMSENFLFCVNQKDNTLSLFSFEKKGNLKEVEYLSTIPNNFKELSKASDVHIHPNGKYVYCSNRGHDSIIVYKFSPKEEKKLTTLQYISSMGNIPRGFTVSQCGKYLIVGNQNSDNICLYLIDQEGGTLEYLREEKEIFDPVCFEWNH